MYKVCPLDDLCVDIRGSHGSDLGSKMIAYALNGSVREVTNKGTKIIGGFSFLRIGFATIEVFCTSLKVIECFDPSIVNRSIRDFLDDEGDSRRRGGTRYGKRI